MFVKMSISRQENVCSFQRTFQNAGLNCIPYGGADLPWMNQSIWLRVHVGERGKRDRWAGVDRDRERHTHREREREREIRGRGKKMCFFFNYLCWCVGAS